MQRMIPYDTNDNIVDFNTNVWVADLADSHIKMKNQNFLDTQIGTNHFFLLLMSLVQPRTIQLHFTMQT